ncbi:MAG: hypothetical protein EXR69_15010 [Myxococcales bacterium]|nr:hypothetical protein [Myxococcales bacterium]
MGSTTQRVLVGADGRVEDTGGTVLLEKPGAGGVLAVFGDRWVTRDPGGVTWDDGSVTPLGGGRPDSLLLDADGLLAGFAFGSIALERSSLQVGRDSRDEAGWALLAFDVDGDGRDEWIVGAPGGNRVDVRDAATLGLIASWTGGTGRFGASLASDGGYVYVGAPMAGTDAQGAVWRCEPVAGACSLLETGLNLQDQLGFSLVWGGQNLYIGAPGGPGTAGAVWVR